MSASAFVERTFTVGDVEVVCRFFKPAPDDGDFRCDYEICWPDRKHPAYGMGVDEVQALLLAMQRAHVQLLASPEGRKGRVRWLDQEDLGLPLPANIQPNDFLKPV